jgi:hypothetical protein
MIYNVSGTGETTMNIQNNVEIICTIDLDAFKQCLQYISLVEAYMYWFFLLFFYHVSIDADIFEASEKGDLARVRALVASGTSTNSRDNVRRRG